MAAEVPNKLNRLRRKDSMLLGRQINKKTQDGAQMYRHPAHAYPLQAAPRPVVAMKDRERWHCDICGYVWTPDGEQRKRYMSCNPREAFNICADCMLAPWSAWISQKNKLLGGDSIIFSDIFPVGVVATDEWPNTNDRDGILLELDKHRRKGDLPWKPSVSRWLRLQIAALEIISDLSKSTEEFPEPGRDYKIFESIKLDVISKVTYLDDFPHSYLLVYADEKGKNSVHVLSVSSRETAVAICEALEKTMFHIYTQAILSSVDDHILAGLEGRSTQTELLAEEQELLAKGAASPEGYGFSDDEDLDPYGRRSSIFTVFPRDTTPSDPSSPGKTAEPTSPVDESKGTVLSQYMKSLQNALSNDELQNFAMLLRAYRTGGNLEKLWHGLIELYGAHRKMLLPGMINFVPSSDRSRYQGLLVANSL